MKSGTKKKKENIEKENKLKRNLLTFYVAQKLSRAVNKQNKHQPKIKHQQTHILIHTPKRENEKEILNRNKFGFIVRQRFEQQ